MGGVCFPELLAGVRPGLHYVPTKLNPADAPSRQRRVPRPSVRLGPEEKRAADMMGDLTVMGHVTCRKQHSRWVELVARYVRRRRSKEDDDTMPQYDPSGLEGDGPPRQQVRRPPVNLMAEFGHLPATVGRRKTLLGRLDRWLWRAFRLTLEDLLDKPLEQADFLMATFGRRCYDGGTSLYDYTEEGLEAPHGEGMGRRQGVAPPYASAEPPASAVGGPACNARAMERDWDLCAVALGLGFLAS